MKDMAYKVLALHSLYIDAIRADNDEAAFDLEWDMGEAGVELAKAVAVHDPFAGHTRLGEIIEYAEKREICIDHAIVELVNKALSLQLADPCVPGRHKFGKNNVCVHCGANFYSGVKEEGKA